MEESTQPNVPMINVPNSAGTGSRLPFWRIWQLFSPWPPDLKLVHSSESTSIGSPGLLLKASLSLCWGWSGCYWLLGESRTYSWFSSFSPRFDLTERNESTAVPRERTPDRHCPRGPHPVPDTHWVCSICRANARIMTRLVVKVTMCSIRALSLWGLRRHFILVQWFLMSWWCYTCVWFICWHYSKYHRFHLCMFFLAKSSYKEVGNHTVLSPVCLWFTKTKQNHII